MGEIKGKGHDDIVSSYATTRAQAVSKGKTFSLMSQAGEGKKQNGTGGTIAARSLCPNWRIGHVRCEDRAAQSDQINKITRRRKQGKKRKTSFSDQGTCEHRLRVSGAARCDFAGLCENRREG